MKYFSIFLAVGLLLAASLSASADQNAAFSALGRIGSTGKVEKSDLKDLKSAPWRGGYKDPLTTMVDWSGVIDSSVCFAGTPPPGWGKALYRVKVENASGQPVRLQVNGGALTVVRARYAGRTQFPAMAIAQTRRGTERFTVLPDGEVCYAVLPWMDAASARNHGWKVTATQLGSRGRRGTWVGVGSADLYTAPLFEGPSETDPVKLRGQRVTRVVFNAYEFD